MTPDQHALIEAGLGWVPTTRFHLSPLRHPDPLAEDLDGEGLLSLCRAAETFDPGYGVAWRSYAIEKIRNAMLEFLRQSAWEPRRCREDRRLAEAARNILGPGASEAEVAAEAGIGLVRLRHSYLLVVLPLSTRIWVDGEAVGVGETVAEVAPEDEDPEEFDASSIWRAVECLSERQRQVIDAIFRDGQTAPELAARWGTTRQAVQAAKQAGLARLRQVMEA